MLVSACQMDLAEILRNGGDGQFVQEREEGVRQREVAPFAGEAKREERREEAVDYKSIPVRLPGGDYYEENLWRTLGI